MTKEDILIEKDSITWGYNVWERFPVCKRFPEKGFFRRESELRVLPHAIGCQSPMSVKEYQLILKGLFKCFFILITEFRSYFKGVVLAPSHVSRRLFECDKRLEWVNHFPVGDKWVMTDPHEPLKFKTNNLLSRIRHRKPTTRGRLVLPKLPWNRTGIPLWVIDLEVFSTS